MHLQSLHKHSDFELIDFALDGDNHSFSELVRRHKSTVASAAMNMLGNIEESNEIGQQTFIRFYKSMGSFKRKSSLKTYLTRIAINLCLNHLKRRQNFANRTIDLDQAQHVSSTDFSSTMESKEVINLALQKLDEKHRSVIVIRMIQGYDTNDAADILGIPRGTVLSRLKRAMDNLKVILQKDFNYEYE